jgi:hypothetical protein
MEGKETTLKELGEMLAHVVKHMATKDELKEFREETAENFRALRAEVVDIRRDLEEMNRAWPTSQLITLLSASPRSKSILGSRRESRHRGTLAGLRVRDRRRAAPAIIGESSSCGG